MKVKPPHVEQLHAAAAVGAAPAGREEAPPTRVVDTPPNTDRMRLEQIRTCLCPATQPCFHSLLGIRADSSNMYMSVKCQSEQKEHQKCLIQREN